MAAATAGAKVPIGNLQCLIFDHSILDPQSKIPQAVGKSYFCCLKIANNPQ